MDLVGRDKLHTLQHCKIRQKAVERFHALCYNVQTWLVMLLAAFSDHHSLQTSGALFSDRMWMLEADTFPEGEDIILKVGGT